MSKGEAESELGKGGRQPLVLTGCLVDENLCPALDPEEETDSLYNGWHQGGIDFQLCWPVSCCLVVFGNISLASKYMPKVKSGSDQSCLSSLVRSLSSQAR